MPIQILNDMVVAQIAAGEVIERPASVVKELMENALDAGANVIHIAVEGGGRRSIQVSDNGQGIPADEVELAFARHATSKLAAAEDLEQIKTLGFRGEALASIAAVSRVSLTTHSPGESAGTQIQVEGGRVLSCRPVGAPAGTVIKVENLFFNTPARLKFLKAENTEKRHIATVVSRYAMAYPDVRFTLEQDGRESLRTNGTGQLSDVLVTTLGLRTFRDTFEFYSDPDRSVRVYGYASLPSHHRSDRSNITLFVNGRWIQDSSLSYAVIQAYHTFLMKGRYPVAVVMIAMPPNEVDVNVHPTKAEVRFQNPNEIFATLQRSLRRALIEQMQTPAITDGSGFIGVEASSSQLGLDMDLESPGWYPHQYLRAQPDMEENDPTAIPNGPNGPVKPRTLPMLRVIGQVGASYIVAEGPSGLYLIDQHAAHERILYEQFMAEYQRQDRVSQYTLASQTIELPPAEAQLLEDNLDALQALGFALEAFGVNTFVIRSIPALLTDQDPVEVIHGILSDLEHGDAAGETAIEDKIVQRVCKQAAVKAGTILSLEEMQGLIRQLERSESPHTCPHGRPTMLHMTSERLAREFGRS